jgi:hypothetical protein
MIHATSYCCEHAEISISNKQIIKFEKTMIIAKVGDNIVNTGFSEKLGNLILFRNHGGKTIVAKAPKKKQTEWSET